MNRLASPAQLRASYYRWALFLVPLVVLLGLLSGQLGGSSADSAWFAALNKPAIFPPPVVFPIVWTALYALMGFARHPGQGARGAVRELDEVGDEGVFALHGGYVVLR